MNSQTKDANERAAELLHKLRSSAHLRAELAAAGVLAESWQECFFGIAAGYPWKLLREKPADVKARNDAFEAAIDRFMDAAVEFERRSHATLLSVSDALRVRDTWQPALTDDEDRILNRAPEVRLFEYLEMIRQRVAEGSYGAHSWIDPQIDTPAGRLPSKPSSLAAWLSIRALRIARATPGAAFNKAAATTATILCGETVGEETIATMLRQEAAAETKRGAASLK